MSAGNVKAELTLETGKFEQSADRATKKIEAAAAAQQKAAEKARAAWEKELIAQDRATEGAARASRAKELAALQSDILSRSLEKEQRIQAQVTSGLDRWVSSVNGSTAAVTRATAAHDAFAASEERVAAGGAHSITEIQATSAAIRTFEGNPGIRAFERFVTTIPGAGAALRAFFPLFGLAAAGAAFFKIGEAIYDIKDKADKAGAAIQLAFGDLNGELRVANEQLTVTNDRLEDDVAKLEKRPSNGLRTGLDEATLAADNLGRSLDKDIGKVTELLEKNKIGFFGGLLGGKGKTEDTGNLVLSVKRDIDKVRKEQDEVVSQARANTGNPDDLKHAVQARLVALQDAYDKGDAALKNAQDAVRKVQDWRNTPASTFGAGLTLKASGVTYSSGRDNTADFNILAGGRDLLLQEQNEIGGDYRREQGEAAKGKAGDNSAAASLESKEAAAARKAAEERLKELDSKLAKAQGEGFLPRSGPRVAEYWQSRIGEFTKGSEQYLQIVEKQAAALEGGRAKLERALTLAKAGRTAEALAELSGERKTDPEAEEASRIAIQVRGVPESFAKDARKTANETVQSNDEIALVHTRTKARLEEITIQERAGRLIDRQAAAMALAAVHTRLYTQELATLEQELKRIEANPDLTGPEKAKQTGKLREQIEAAQGGRAEQVARDQVAIDPGTTSAVVGFRDALIDASQKSRDFAQQAQEFVTSTLSKLNSTFVEELTSRSRTGPRHLFTKAGHDIATSAAGAGVKDLTGFASGYIEKLPFSKLFGKGAKKELGDSSANPIWTRSAETQNPSLPTWLGGSDGATSAVSNVVSSFAKPGDSGSNGIFSALGAIVPFLGFANGVSAFGGGMAMVGERGPEIVNLPGGSSVTPNHKMPQFDGGGDTHNHYYDLRQTNDPAQIKAIMRQYVPGIEASAAERAGKQAYETKRRSITGGRG